MKNVGGAERMARDIFGTGFVVADLFANVQIEALFLAIGLWGVLTSALGYCPFNSMMGRSTCAVDLRADA